MKYLIITLLFCNLFSAQSNVDFSEIIKNGNNYFEGKKDENQQVKFTFDSVYSNNEDEYFVEGIAEIGDEISSVSGKINFNKKETKKFRNPSMYNFDVVLNIGKESDQTKVFKGQLNIKMIPKIFNVIVFEGIYQDENGKDPMHFDNSEQIMKYLESLKK